MINHPQLSNYFNGGFKKVNGWCSDNLFNIIEILDGCTINKEGGIAEIGVHHGKFFLLLNSITEERFKSFAIDLFGAQHLNIDFSGRGDLEIFKTNFDLNRIHS